MHPVLFKTKHLLSHNKLCTSYLSPTWVQSHVCELNIVSPHNNFPLWVQYSKESSVFPTSSSFPHFSFGRTYTFPCRGHEITLTDLELSQLDAHSCTCDQCCSFVFVESLCETPAICFKISKGGTSCLWWSRNKEQALKLLLVWTGGNFFVSFSETRLRSKRPSGDGAHVCS